MRIQPKPFQYNNANIEIGYVDVKRNITNIEIKRY